jgi:hypothetical protein
MYKATPCLGVGSSRTCTRIYLEVRYHLSTIRVDLGKQETPCHSRIIIVIEQSGASRLEASRKKDARETRIFFELQVIPCLDQIEDGK